MKKAGSLVREYWRTDPEALPNTVHVTYSPLEGAGKIQKRFGGSESISVRLSLVEYKNDILANGSIILDGETSLTRHPLEIIFKDHSFEADEEGITLTVDSTACDICTLTTKTESGTLIQPNFILTMEIIAPIKGQFTCHGTIEIESLYTIGEFSIPIEREENDDPLSFVESTWGRKNRYFEISYPRKFYSEQGEESAVADRDILKLNISETESKVLSGSEFYLPASLSPNGAAMTIDLSDSMILSSLLNNVVIEKSGILDTVDMDGDGLSTAYRLSLRVMRKYVMETREQSLCVSSCKDKCAIDFSGVQRQTCLMACENSTCVVKAEQYTLTASLAIDGLDTRTAIVETLKRNDDVAPDADEDGFHDNFYGAKFLLPKDETYSVTHALSTGEITDVAQVSYDMVSLEMTVMDDGTKGLVQGQIRIPREACPDRMPYTFIEPSTTIFLGTSGEKLETLRLTSDFSSFETGTPDRAGWVSTKIDKTYMTNEGELTVEEQGFLHLAVTTQENGTRQFRLEFAGADSWTRINITGMEVSIKNPPTETNPAATFALVESPRQVVICNETVNNLLESDVDVSMTLCKRWKNGVESIRVKEGRVSVGHNMGCTGAFTENIPTDAMVDMDEEGFTLIAALTAVYGEEKERIDDAMTINLAKLSDDEFEFQVFLPVKEDRSEDLSFYLPAQRISGTGVFVSSAAQ